MQYDEKIRLLKGLRVLKQIPERQLAALAEFLRPKAMEDGGVVFQEGSTGMSLYFVSSGKIRITKRVAADATKDLALLGPGEFFGEMALIEEATRSASAVALGPCVLFELFRGDLSRWVKSNPSQAVQFFAELVHVQSLRLRRTSNELTLHFDLSSLLLESPKLAPELLAQVLDRVLPHLEGAWSAAAFLRLEPGGPGRLVASRGEPRVEELAQKLAAVQESGGFWLDESMYHAGLLGRAGPLGRLVFRCAAPVPKDEREDLGRTLTTVSRLVSTALELQQLARAAPAEAR